MAVTTDPKIGDRVRVVSGTHEGRSGVLTQLREVQMGYKDPEWYGVVAYEETNANNERYTDHIALPVRRLKPTS